ASLGRALRQTEPRAVVGNDLPDRDDAVALLRASLEELVEIAREIAGGCVAPRDELEGAGRGREHHAERRLADVLTGHRRDQPPAVEPERAAAVASADLELAGLVGRVDEPNDGLE